MRTVEFTYLKEGVKTNRHVLVAVDNEKFLEGIDLEKLDAADQGKLKELNADFEEAIKPYIKKAWRRFDQNKITY